MAFSTQKDFLKIGFLNENLTQTSKKRSDAALKNYESCTDHRAWSLNEESRSNYLVDIVKRLPGLSMSAPTVATDSPSGDADLTLPVDLVMEKEDLRKMSKETLIDLILKLYQEIKKKDQRLQKLQKQAVELDASIEAASRDSQVLEQERNELRSQMSKMLDLEPVLVDLQGRASHVDDISKENEQLREIIDNLQSKLNGYEAENSFIKTKHSDSDKCLAELAIFKANYLTCQKTNHELKTKLLEADCCEQELEETKRKLCKACKQIKSCDAEIEKLIKIIENQQQDIETLDENLRRSRLEVEQMSNLQSDVQSLKEQLSFAIDNRIAEETSLMNQRNMADFHATIGHNGLEPSSSRSSRQTATLFEQTISRTSSALNLSDPSPVEIAVEAHTDNLQSLIEENTKLKAVISECRTRLRVCQEAAESQNFSEQPDPDTNPNEIVQQIIASNVEKSRLQDENESLKMARKTLETDIASIQFHSEYLQRDFEELKETNDQLNEKLEACNTTIQQHLLTIKTLQQELNASKEASEKSLEIHSRQSIMEIESKEQEIARVSKELAEKSENLESEIETVIELREQLTKAMFDLQKAEKCCQQKTEENEQNLKELLMCQEVCDMKAAELNLLHEENLELKGEVKRMRAEINETVTELQHVEGKKIVDLEEKIVRISETLENSVQPLTSGLEIPDSTMIEDEPLKITQNISPATSVHDLRETPTTTADIAQRETEIQNLIDDIDQSVHEVSEPVPDSERLPPAADVNREDVETTLEQLTQELLRTKALEQQVRDLENQLLQTQGTNEESMNELQQEINQLKADIVQYQAKAKELEALSTKMNEEISRKNDLIKDLEQKIQNLSKQIESITPIVPAPPGQVQVTIPSGFLSDHQQIEREQMRETIDKLMAENESLRNQEVPATPLQKVCIKLRDNGVEALTTDDLKLLHGELSKAVNKQKANTVIGRFFPSNGESGEAKHLSSLSEHVESSKKVLKVMKNNLVTNAPTRIPSSFQKISKPESRSLLKRSRAFQPLDTHLNRQPSAYEIALMNSPYNQHPNREYVFGKSHGNRLHIRKRVS